MTKSNDRLTVGMLKAILRVTKIENEEMCEALQDVLVEGATPSVSAQRHGFKRQQLHVRLKHIRDDLKPAFDAYAAEVQAKYKKKDGLGS